MPKSESKHIYALFANELVQVCKVVSFPPCRAIRQAIGAAPKEHRCQPGLLAIHPSLHSLTTFSFSSSSKGFLCTGPCAMGVGTSQRRKRGFWRLKLALWLVNDVDRFNFSAHKTTCLRTNPRLKIVYKRRLILKYSVAITGK